MASGRISKRTVDALQPGDRDVFMWDSDLRGFGLKVTPKGARSYVFQYRPGGREAKTRRYTIGTHGSPWTPSSAREEAERLALLVGQGIDPAAVDLERRRQAVELAFDRYAETFLDKYVRPNWSTSQKSVEGQLRLHVTPHLGSRPLPSITRADLTRVMEALPAGKAALRASVFATIRRLFRWAVSRGDLDRSPLEGMERPPAAASRDRVLSDAELSLVWRAAPALSWPFGPVFRLLIVTGQRREEVTGLDWSELDSAAALWTLPAERAKNGAQHLVPLSEQALAELDVLARHAGATERAGKLEWPRSGLIFSTTGRTPVSGHSRAKDRLDAAVAKLAAVDAAEQDRAAEPLPAWRVHDLRRTLATGLQRLGVRFEVTEAVLNHVSGARGGVAGVYQRHHWSDEKRAALDAWGRHVAALDRTPTAGNVVPLRRRRRSAAA